MHALEEEEPGALHVPSGQLVQALGLSVPVALHVPATHAAPSAFPTKAQHIPQKAKNAPRARMLLPRGPTPRPAYIHLNARNTGAVQAEG
jgi:hypothetical protein